MEQLSLFDLSTNIYDYLPEIKHDISISKKLSKSINSKGFYIIMYKKKRLCYVGLKKFETYIQLEVRRTDDWQGIMTPCSPEEVSVVLNERIDKYIKERGEL